MHARQIARLQRGDDFIVLGLLGGEAFGNLLRRARIFVGVALRRVDARDREMRVQAFVNLGEAPVTRGFNQQQMHFAVGLFMLPQRLFVDHRLAQQLQQFVQFLHPGGPHAVHRLLRRQTLKRDADIEGRVNILQGQGGHEGSAARLDFNQPFGGQLLNGMAHGRQTDAQAFGDLVDLQPLTGFEEPIQDGVPQVFINLVGRAFPGQAA